MKVIGYTVGTTLPKPNLAQTDPTKGDYVKNIDALDDRYYTEEEIDAKLGEINSSIESLNNASSEYETKADAQIKLDDAKAYADSAATAAANTVKQELSDLISDNTDAIDTLEDVVATKADAEHNHDDRYYTKAEFDAFELISVDEIDGICGATIQVASLNEVTF